MEKNYEEQKKQYIEIATAMGFNHDSYGDNWDKDEDVSKCYLRFELKEELDEPDLRWIVWKDETIVSALARASRKIFQAGQKQYRINLTKYTSL